MSFLSTLEYHFTTVFNSRMSKVKSVYKADYQSRQLSQPHLLHIPATRSREAWIWILKLQTQQTNLSRLPPPAAKPTCTSWSCSRTSIVFKPPARLLLTKKSLFSCCWCHTIVLKMRAATSPTQKTQSQDSKLWQWSTKSDEHSSHTLQILQILWRYNDKNLTNCAS